MTKIPQSETDPKDYELDRLRSANAELMNALELAITTIERLVTIRNGFSSADGTLTVARKAIKSNKR